MSWKKFLKNVIGKVGKYGLTEAEEALDNLEKKTDEPWKRAILEMVGDAVDKYGLEGIAKVQKAVDQIAAGKKPDISFASLRARSDFLATLQNMEADDKKKAKDFFKVIGSTLGVIIKAVIKAFLKG